MTNKFRIGAAGVAVISAFGMAGIANAAVETADAEANILAAITITVDASLNFGDIAVNGAGTVDVPYDGSGAVCSANLVCAGGDNPGAFSLTGAADLDVSIVLDNVVDLSGPGTDLVLSGLTDSEGGSMTLDNAGEGSFTDGGTIAVAAGQAAGVYTGSFDVTVEYQ
jgi:hypothetical protein